MKLEAVAKFFLIQEIFFKSLSATATFFVTSYSYSSSSSKKHNTVARAEMSRKNHQNSSNQHGGLSSDDSRSSINDLPVVRFPMAFDAHNHIHLSKPGGIPPLSEFERNKISPNPITPQFEDRPCDDEMFALARKILDSFTVDDVVVKKEEPSDGDNVYESNSNIAAAIKDKEMKRPENTVYFPKVRGLAIMSTQPRDFPVVEQLRDAMHLISTQQTIADEKKQAHTQYEQIIVPCYGVHPWFLAQANKDFSTIVISDQGLESDIPPAWLPYLREKLQSDPHSHLGEIGLDGARYEIDPVTQQKVLVSSMEDQIRAFEAQMHLAADLKKSVSIHAVQCWGAFMDSLRRIKSTRMKLRKEKRSLDKNKDNDLLILPPKIYFHAFGGKAAVVDQLDAICKDKSMESLACETFYGFAPVINFRSPKTASVMHRVGIDRLLLETDLEDYQCVREDVRANAEFAARVLNMELNEVLQRTFENACRLYNIS
jgi:Tat protein secretion system quality control protein TatD with DNase activity